MTNNVSILDATLRDGGQGLEDLNKNGFSRLCFDESDKSAIISHLSQSGVEMIELGAIGPSKDNKNPFAIYQTIEELSQYLPPTKTDRIMYLGLYIGPDTDINLIPHHDESLVEGVRVILRYSELQKSLDYCQALSRKGYKVFVQPMLTMRYTQDELERVIQSANDMNAYACYFVDSYGYMGQEDIQRFYELYDRLLAPGIRMGFHAHNNMNMAMANAIHFSHMANERPLILDACATGMGQGAGNLATEMIVPYMNTYFGKDYKLDNILEVCDLLDRKMLPSSPWGYSLTCFLPALYKTAYKYAIMMRMGYHLPFTEINRLLRDMPDDMRNRYTSDNLTKIISSSNH